MPSTRKRRPDETATGAGDPNIPYDQSPQQLPMPNDPMAMGPPDGGGQDPLAAMGLSGGADMGIGSAPPDLGGLGAPQGQGPAPNAGMDPGLGAGSGNSEVDAMIAALDDPNTPPEVRSQIQQELDLAARRLLAGMGGGVG